MNEELTESIRSGDIGRTAKVAYRQGSADMLASIRDAALELSVVGGAGATMSLQEIMAMCDSHLADLFADLEPTSTL
jgi:hypothetical protein